MRLGMIGLKGHEGLVIQGARQLGNVELVALFEEAGADLEAFQKKPPLPGKFDVYRDWRHLVEHAMMDVCCVCDENGRRPEQLIALAERNIHIVTDKPLATTLEDLERVRAALLRSKSRLTMLLAMRYETGFAKIRALVRAGAIGEVCQVAMQKSYQLGDRPGWFKERKRLGGIIPYIGIHAVDMIRWVSGLAYTHVAGVQGRIGKPQMQETEDHATLLLRLSNGASAGVQLDYLRPDTAPTHGDNRLRVAGSEGILELRDLDATLALITGKEKLHVLAAQPGPNLFVDFADALKKDAPLPIPEEDCFYATEVVLKARSAAEEKKVVELASPRAFQRSG